MNATTTLGFYQFTETFQYFRFGVGAAVAALVLAVTMLLGLVVGLIVVLAGLRLEIVPWGKRSALISRESRPGRGRTAAIVLLAVTLLVSLGICSLSVLPLPWNALNSLKTEAEMVGSPLSLFPSSPSLDSYGDLGDLIPIAKIVVNTIVPPLSVLLLQVPIVYLSALGIGAVRPFKKLNDWLLLLLSPWLFVTIGPLSIAAFQTRRSADLLNTTAGLASPIVLSVPALFVLTLFFKGQEPRWRAALAEGQSPAGAFFTKLILPSLPLALLLACASFLVGLQGLLWPLIAAVGPESLTANLALMRLAYAELPWSVRAAALTLFGLPPFAFFFLTFGLFQLLYMDHLALVRQPSDAKE